MRKITITIICVLLFTSPLNAGEKDGNSFTKEDYHHSMHKALELIIKRSKPRPGHKLLFAANLFYAHGSVIENMPMNILKAIVDAFKKAGFGRVNINLSVWPWVAGNQTVIEKYDEIIEYIRDSGFQLALNPQYTPTDGVVTSFQQWSEEAVAAYSKIARRYQPQIFVLVHEPSTMNARMNLDISSKQWASFVKKALTGVKYASPKTRCGTGVLWTEMKYFKEFIKIKRLELLSIDIYDLKGLKVYNRMINSAQKAGKVVYIEETWRPPFYVPEPGKKVSLESYISTGIGDQSFQPLDAKWFEAMTRYANAWELEAITPFWMQTFFLYVQENEPNGALDTEYNKAVVVAISENKRTETVSAIKNTIEKWD